MNSGREDKKRACLVFYFECARQRFRLGYELDLMLWASGIYELN